MTDELIAGAPTLWPAVVDDGTGVPGRYVHLARAQARRKAPPELVAVCPDVDATVGPLVRAPAPTWWRLSRRRRWCPQCRRYRDYARGRGLL